MVKVLEKLFQSSSLKGLKIVCDCEKVCKIALSSEHAKTVLAESEVVSNAELVKELVEIEPRATVSGYIFTGQDVSIVIDSIAIPIDRCDLIQKVFEKAVEKPRLSIVNTKSGLYIKIWL
jgi:hypothetical protein